MITITTDNSNVDLRQDIQIQEIIDDITITKGTKESKQKELDNSAVHPERSYIG